MKTPIHSVLIEFSHSSEAKALLEVVAARFAPAVDEKEIFLDEVETQLEGAVELLESLEE